MDRYEELVERYSQILREHFSGKIAEMIGELRGPFSEDEVYPSLQRSIIISYSDLFAIDRELAEEMLRDAETHLAAADEALTNLAKHDLPKMFLKSPPRFHVRISDLPTKVTLRRLQDVPIGSFISLSGIVIRVSDVLDMVSEAAYVCDSCGAVVMRPPELPPPKECPNCERGKMVFSAEKSKFINYQVIRIQERPEDLPPGALPRSIDAVLEDDAVETVKPGDRVTVTAIVALSPAFKREKGAPRLFRRRLRINYIRGSMKLYEKVEITPEDEEKIRELARDPDLEEKIVGSIAPSIYGLESKKLAIALALFGGEDIVMPDGTKIRGNINILFVGDPGTAKSQLLKFTANVAPRGLYTSGKGSTAAGLTAAVVRDPTTGGWSLEAGALVLADRGVALIDEFDKMNENDRRSIHEAMEQHTVSIAKAGIVATLNARTTIIAAANPKMGRYDPLRTVAENINLPPPILSRFDLIFLIRDIPDAELDRAIARHILTARLGENVDVHPKIPLDLLKKYIVYARQNVHPRLTREAAEKIEEFYLKMRSDAARFAAEVEGAIPIPLTARQLEALVRLAEARARMFLREEVTVEDAETAIRLMSEMLQEVAKDVATNSFDISAIVTGKFVSSTQRRERIIEVIGKMQDELDAQMVPVDRVVARLKEEIGVDETILKRDFDALREAGLLYSPQPGFLAVAGKKSILDF